MESSGKIKRPNCATEEKRPTAEAKIQGGKVERARRVEREEGQKKKELGRQKLSH